MSGDMAKARKKEAKAAAKIEKARARAAGAGGATAERSAPEHSTPEHSTPDVGSSFRAGLLRFMKEGAFQTIVKIVAGLVVGYLLIKFGLR